MPPAGIEPADGWTGWPRTIATEQGGCTPSDRSQGNPSWSARRYSAVLSPVETRGVMRHPTGRMITAQAGDGPNWGYGPAHRSDRLTDGGRRQARFKGSGADRTGRWNWRYGAVENAGFFGNSDPATKGVDHQPRVGGRRGQSGAESYPFAAQATTLLCHRADDPAGAGRPAGGSLARAARPGFAGAVLGMAAAALALALVERGAATGAQ